MQRQDPDTMKADPMKEESSATKSSAYDAPREIMLKMRGDEGTASSVDSSALAEPFGARLRRREDPRLLNGHTTFIEGMQRPRMAGVAFAPSDQAHARIRSIDTSRAKHLQYDEEGHHPFPDEAAEERAHRNGAERARL